MWVSRGLFLTGVSLEADKHDLLSPVRFRETRATRLRTPLIEDEDRYVLGDTVGWGCWQEKLPSLPGKRYQVGLGALKRRLKAGC